MISRWSLVVLQTMITLPRLLLAAPMSGSGKTTITAGIIAALRARGLQVAPFKCGPDYIDPSYHALAAGRPCANLDAWMLPPEQIASVLARRSVAADLALIEGVMGLFDGYAGDNDVGSSAHIARLTDTPVLLVLDVRAMARTAAALVAGLRDFDPHLRLAGVILNNAGSSRHVAMVQRAIEDSLAMPVLGAFVRDEQIALPERHLGLVPTAELGRWNAWLAEVQARVERGIDLDRLLEIAGTAPPLQKQEAVGLRRAQSSRGRQVARGETMPPTTSLLPPVIAVARDEAFSFIYEDNLDLLVAAGAQLAFFSPLRDQGLPAGTRAIYLSGGFPELYAEQLSANRPMLQALRDADMPIYAECGGLMYLTELLVDAEGRSHPMVGRLPGHSAMTGRLTLGYRTVQAQADSWLWRAGETVRGHEFHYSIWEQRPETIPALYERLPDVMRPVSAAEGAQIENTLASYVHLHFLAHPEIASRFVAAAKGD
jgi:cobyrinic acid a,c-diamide synthase